MSGVKWTRRAGGGVAGAVCLAVLLAGCRDGHSSAQTTALNDNQKLQRQIYQQKNNIEFNNYNQRQRISDDPSTILWCTIYYTNPNVKPVTYPIVGKLTSSDKRPYSSTYVSNDNSGSYSPEVPGPDLMYGASVPYRYGFTPGGVYVDFTGVESTCTTQPTIYQATQTQVVLKVDGQLDAVAKAASAALKAGQRTNGTITPAAGAAAQRILEDALGGAR